MITKDFLKTLSNKYQTLELNIRREYFQHLFLSYFYKQKEASNIYFKGGTALRILYKSPRFSQDLDFTASTGNIKGFEELLLETLSQIEKENTTVSLKESKQTSGGFLAIFSFEALGQITDVRLEISQRLGLEKGDILSADNDFIPTYTVFALEQDQLVDEKMRALFARKKPRDFYDLYFILRANLLPVKKKGILPKALAILKQTDIKFEKELKQFLPKSHWAIMRDFKAVLAREIQRFI